MGKDGDDGDLYISGMDSLHFWFGQDAFGYTLGYYDGDYEAISWPGMATTDKFEAANTTASFTTTDDLYNGNINHMVTALSDTNQNSLAVQATAYNYDQLHRITALRAYQQANIETTNSWSSPSVMTAYQSDFTYDGNGNLQTLKRNGDSPTGMDQLEYVYYSGTNKLEYVTDSKPAGNYIEDIDGQSAGNYTYDDIGNLTRDNAEEIDTILWNNQNKIREIIFDSKSKKDDLEFRYDPMGNRIVKIVKGGADEDTWTYTYYSRDANGQIMAVYEKEYLDETEAGNIPDPEWPDVNDWLPGDAEYMALFKTAEYHLYGSDRLGIHLYDDTIAAHVFKTNSTEEGFDDDGYFQDTSLLTPTFPIPYIEPPNDGTWFYTFTRGKKRYELTNHLGNVLETVSDRKIAIDSSGTVGGYTVDVWAMNDYYAFGMLMPGRNMHRGGYRFGFNGKEGDDEIKGNGNSYDFGARILDPRIGRWLNRDPLERKYPEISPFVGMGNNPTFFIDPNGKEIIIHYLVVNDQGRKEARQYVYGSGQPVPNNDYLKETIRAIDLLAQITETPRETSEYDPTPSIIVERLSSSTTKKYNIKAGRFLKPITDKKHINSEGQREYQTKWNPFIASENRATNGEREGEIAGYSSPAAILGHEMRHAFHRIFYLRRYRRTKKRRNRSGKYS